jgi:Family of unknown function (DUF5343)
MESEQTKLTAPYVPFVTFINALDHLKTIGVPNTIDRAVFPSFSGLMQGQVIGAFKFLGLIDEHGKPSHDLGTLTDAKDRKAVLKELLKKRYSTLVSLDLTKVSPTTFDKTISEYGVAGATHQKAKSFFLKVAQYAELPLSPLLTRKTRSSGGGTRRKKTNGEQNITKTPHVSNNINPGTTKTITLKSGGELTLSLTVNLFDLIGDDRDFVFGIIDKIQTYQKGASKRMNDAA